MRGRAQRRGSTSSHHVQLEVVAAMPPNRIVKHTHKAIDGSSLGFRPRSHERGSVSKPQSHLLQGHAASRAHACIYNHNSPPRPTGTSSRRTNTIPFVISPPWRGTTVTGGGNLQKTIPAMPITGVWDSTVCGTFSPALPPPYPLTFVHSRWGFDNLHRSSWSFKSLSASVFFTYSRT